MGLYDDFKCYGHFYKINKRGVVIASCRSQLDIINTKNMNNDDIGSTTLDALAIMMNPGTSRPEDNTYQEQQIELEKFPLKINQKSLVPTIPDDTQKRLMKIMLHKRWKHVRVINLSDIRQHQSEKLATELNNYKLHSLKQEHSLFSQIRNTELVETLDQIHSKPIILAWGTRTCLKEFVIECQKALVGKTFFGAKAARKGYYHHPLTTKLKWAEAVINLLDSYNLGAAGGR